MERMSFRTKLTAEIDVAIENWMKVKDVCMEHGNSRTIDEFSERLSQDFWKAQPVQTDRGVVRHMEIGTFIEDESGLNHQLEDTDLYGKIALTISKDLDSEKVEKIS